MLDPRLMAPVQMDGFANAFKEGRKARDENIAKAAYAALVRDPNNQKAFEALANVRPDLAEQIQQRRQQAAQEQIKEYQGTIQSAAEMAANLQARNPGAPKEQIYGAVRQGLIQMRAHGADQIPEQFSENHWNLISSLSKPPQEPRGRIVTPQPGAGAWMLNDDGSIRELIKPNDGSQPMGAPAASGPPPGHVEDGYRFKGGNPADPNAWEPIGGQTPQASGGFPPSGN